MQQYDGMVQAASGQQFPHRSRQRATYHHGDLPNALTDAATEMARAGGPDAVVLRAAARTAGVSAAAAYRHFADHDDLLSAVRQRALAALAAAMRASLEAGPVLPDPAEESIRRLRALGSAYLSFALTDPGLFRTAFCRPEKPMTDVAHKMAANGPFALLSEVLDGMVENGVLDGDRREGAEVAAWAAVHGLATLLLDGPLALLTEKEQARARARIADFVLDGIRGGR